jgi:hypothetical protein
MNTALLEKPTNHKLSQFKILTHSLSSFNFSGDREAGANSREKIDRETGMIIEPMQGCCELVDWLQHP